MVSMKSEMKSVEVSCYFPLPQNKLRMESRDVVQIHLFPSLQNADVLLRAVEISELTEFIKL